MTIVLNYAYRNKTHGNINELQMLSVVTYTTKSDTSFLEIVYYLYTTKNIMDTFKVNISFIIYI